MGVVQKGYNFAGIIYPDSVKPGWVDRIRDTHIKCFVSPLHEPEEESERQKKPHKHLLLMFDKQTSLRQAIETFEFITGLEEKYVEIIRSLPGYARYLLHLDDQDKQQFDTSVSVSCYNGANYDRAIDTDESFIENLEAMTDYILADPDITFRKFSTFARYNNREWFRILSMRSTIYIRTLIASIREEEKEKAIEEEKKFSR